MTKISAPSFDNSAARLRPVRFSKRRAKTVLPDDFADSIRVLAFSDWRVQDIGDVFRFVQSIEPVDFILYGGDDLGRFEEEGFNYFSELASHTKSNQVLAVIGNDDLYQQKRVLKAKDVHDLYSQSYIFKNFAFIGLEASTSGPALFKHKEEHFKEHLTRQFKQVRGRRLVILSHTPPYGVLDRGIRFAEKDEFTRHIGSTSLRHFTETKPVDLIICGHCHSQGGNTEKLGDTTIVNVSSHDNRGAKGRFAVISLANDGTIDIEWHDTHEIIDTDSLRQIYGIGPIKAEKLVNSGVRTISEFVNCKDLAKLSLSSELSEKYLGLLQLRGKSLLENKVYQVAPFSIDQKKAIFFDIETDITRKRVWLIGLQIDGKFNQLYADNWKQEKRILVEFSKILADNPDYTLISFSGTNFDYRITLGAMQRHGMKTDHLESHSHIDLSTLLRRCFIFPNQRFALKDLGSYLKYPFRNPDLDGLAVALAYHRHAEEGKPLSNRILKYNEDDVKVLPFLISKACAYSQETGSA